MSVRLSTHPHGTLRIPLNFSKINLQSSSFIKIWQEWRLLYITANIYFGTYFTQLYLKREIFHTKAVEKIKKNILYKNFVISKSYTLSKKNPWAWNFLSPEPEVRCGTVAIIIRVVLFSPYLRIRGVSLSSIHYNQSHRVYIDRKQQ